MDLAKMTLRVPKCLYADDAVVFLRVNKGQRRMETDSARERRKCNVAQVESRSTEEQSHQSCMKEYEKTIFGKMWRVDEPCELNCGVKINYVLGTEGRSFKIWGQCGARME